VKVAFVDTKHGLLVCVARRGASRDVAHAPASGEMEGSESLQVRPVIHDSESRPVGCRAAASLRQAAANIQAAARWPC
jgi:hypothetical protein